jgi:hypothetical protein
LIFKEVAYTMQKIGFLLNVEGIIRSSVKIIYIQLAKVETINHCVSLLIILELL